MNTNFIHWLRTFVEEKGLDREQVFEVQGPVWGLNSIPLGVVLEHIEIAPAHEQAAIKSMLVKIDFCNGDVTDYLRHLAQAIAI